MSFEAELQEVSLLRDTIAVVSEIIDETGLMVTADGLKMRASDRAVVAVIDFTLNKNAFAYYNYEKDECMGINLENFLQILRRVGPDDKLKIKLDGNKLHISVSGIHNRNFVLPLIDISVSELPPVDKLNFSASFDIDSSLLNSGIEDADIVTDSVVFTVQTHWIKMKAESDSALAELSVDINKGIQNMEVKEPVRARFSLDYLKKIIKSKKLSSSAKISMATDYPMKLDFNVPGKLNLGFILAPRVEDV